MKHMKSRLESLQRVYRLTEITSSLATTVQAWLVDDEITAHYGDLLSKSPLAQEIVSDLRFKIWNLAFTWECEMDYDPTASIQALEDGGKDGLRSSHRDTDDSRRSPDHCAMDLKQLKEAAKVGTAVLREIFEYYFFMAPSDSSIRIFDAVKVALDRLECDLAHNLPRLEQILVDVGYVTRSNKHKLAKRTPKRPRPFYV